MTGTRPPRLERRPVPGAVFVFGAAALWATFGLFARVLYTHGHTPVEVASVRTFIALIGVVVVAAPRLRSLRIHVRDVPFFVAHGVIGFAAFELLLLGAFARLPVAVAVALLYTAPAFVQLLSRILWKERIPRPRQIALLLALAGVFLVSGAASGLGRGRLGGIDAIGLGLGLAAGLGYAAYTIFGKIALQRTSSTGALFWSFLFATIPLAILAFPLTPMIRSPASIPAFLGVGILPTSLAYFLYLRALHTLRASTASVLACAEPVFAALFAAVLLDERIAWPQGVGVVLVVTASVMLVGGSSVAVTTD